MADFTWTGGAGDGNWNTAGNWAGGAAPSSSASNHVYINAANATTPSITVGPSSAIDLGSLNILGGFGGTSQGVTFGTAAVVPLFGTITTLNIINTRCSFIKISCTAITTANIRALGGATLYLVAGACTTLNGGPDGRIEVSHDFALTTVRRAGGSMLIAGKTTPANMTLRLGRSATLDCWRRIADGIIDGKMTVEYAADGSNSGNGVLTINATGRMVHKATGTFDSIEVMEGGQLDGSKNPGAATKPTITTLIRNPGARISVAASMFTVTNETINGVEDAPPG